MPATGMAAFSLLFFSSLPSLDSHHLILGGGGDFNCSLNPALDRSSSKSASVSKTALAIKSFLDSCAISDPWHFLFPSTRQYSFFSHVHHTYSRIEYLFLDNKITPFIRSCTWQYCHFRPCSSYLRVNFPTILLHPTLGESTCCYLVQFITSQIDLFFGNKHHPRDFSLHFLGDT